VSFSSSTARASITRYGHIRPEVLLKVGWSRLLWIYPVTETLQVPC